MGLKWEEDKTAHVARLGEWSARIRGEDFALEVEIGQSDVDDDGVRRDSWERETEVQDTFIQGIVHKKAIAMRIVEATLRILHEEDPTAKAKT